MAPQFTPGVRNLGNQIVEVGRGVVESCKTTGRNWFGITSKSGGLAGSAMGGVARAGGSVLDKTANALGNSLRPLTWAMKKMPWLAPISLITGGALWYKGHVDAKRESALKMMELQNQYNAAAMNAAADSPYRNSVTSPEWQLTKSRMRGGIPGEPSGMQVQQLEARDKTAELAAKP